MFNFFFIFHIVDPSSWPFLTGIAATNLVISLVSYMHRFTGSFFILLFYSSIDMVNSIIFKILKCVQVIVLFTIAGVVIVSYMYRFTEEGFDFLLSPVFAEELGIDPVSDVDPISDEPKKERPGKPLWLKVTLTVAIITMIVLIGYIHQDYVKRGKPSGGFSSAGSGNNGPGPGPAPSAPGSGPSVSGSAPSVPGSGPSVSGSAPSVPGSGPSVSGSAPSAPGSGPSVSGSAPSVPWFWSFELLLLGAFCFWLSPFCSWFGSFCFWLSPFCSWFGSFCFWLSPFCSWFGSFCFWLSPFCSWFGSFCFWLSPFCSWFGS